MQNKPCLVSEARQARRHRRLKTLLRTHRNVRAVIAWLNDFPADALEFLEGNGFIDRRWPVMTLWIKAPGLRQVMQDIPALGWIASQCYFFNPDLGDRPLEHLQAVAGRPRKELLALLGIPGGDGMLNLIKQAEMPRNRSFRSSERAHHV